MKTLQQVIKAQKEEQLAIEKMTEIAKTLEYLEEYGVCDWLISTWYIAAHIPPGDTFRKVRRAMGPGWKRSRGESFTSDEGNLFIPFTKDGVDLTIVIKAAYANGTTCQRIQTGEKTVPVYQIICQ